MVLEVLLLWNKRYSMPPTKLPNSVFLTIEVIGWLVMVPVIGMILTFIGESIYASLIIAH